MTKTEIVAKFMGYTVTQITDLTDYYLKYNNLMPVWVKFRDLKLEDDLLFYKHEKISDIISRSITYGTITEAFDELVKGIEWAESLKNSENKQDLVN